MPPPSQSPGSSASVASPLFLSSSSFYSSSFSSLRPASPGARQSSTRAPSARFCAASLSSTVVSSPFASSPVASSPSSPSFVQLSDAGARLWATGEGRRRWVSRGRSRGVVSLLFLLVCLLQAPRPDAGSRLRFAMSSPSVRLEACSAASSSQAAFRCLRPFLGSRELSGCFSRAQPLATASAFSPSSPSQRIFSPHASASLSLYSAPLCSSRFPLAADFSSRSRYTGPSRLTRDDAPLPRGGERCSRSNLFPLPLQPLSSLCLSSSSFICLFSSSFSYPHSFSSSDSRTQRSSSPAGVPPAPSGSAAPFASRPPSLSSSLHAPSVAGGCGRRDLFGPLPRSRSASSAFFALPSVSSSLPAHLRGLASLLSRLLLQRESPEKASLLSHVGAFSSSARDLQRVGTLFSSPSCKSLLSRARRRRSLLSVPFASLLRSCGSVLFNRLSLFSRLLSLSAGVLSSRLRASASLVSASLSPSALLRAPTSLMPPLPPLAPALRLLMVLAFACDSFLFGGSLSATCAFDMRKELARWERGGFFSNFFGFFGRAVRAGLVHANALHLFVNVRSISRVFPSCERLCYEVLFGAAAPASSSSSASGSPAAADARGEDACARWCWWDEGERKGAGQRAAGRRGPGFGERGWLARATLLSLFFSGIAAGNGVSLLLRRWWAAVEWTVQKHTREEARQRRFWGGKVSQEELWGETEGVPRCAPPRKNLDAWARQRRLEKLRKARRRRDSEAGAAAREGPGDSLVEREEASDRDLLNDDDEDEEEAQDSEHAKDRSWCVRTLGCSAGVCSLLGVLVGSARIPSATKRTLGGQLLKRMLTEVFAPVGSSGLDEPGHLGGFLFGYLVAGLLGW
ncbi:hypothetical protein BESB_014850 [Besnoitia besnoiti]|uniref:Uncharacterized protein n=1 Tax=Besnoitia besnoiti TaxID=94643 RepID=A0A2A9MBV2_BESBE|nr:hypothetical protein BESB_014850 [Besnoitia besnoiti]PFH32872.1 hypothetical protein BESB_014850 [Besnoitia besnoiti]